MNKEFFKRTWAEIDLDAIDHNYKVLRRHVDGSAMYMAVVKADAYGHGVEGVASLLEKNGADWFAVSCLSEAMELRNAGITRPVLILGYTPEELTSRLSENQITQTVYSLDYAKALSAAAQRENVTVDIHIKLDVGMGRLGFYADSDDDIAKAIEACKLPGLRTAGVFTHFPVADSKAKSDIETTENQFTSFLNAVEKIENSGIHFEIKHCSNSAASIMMKTAALNMVREGIAMYGLSPSGDLEGMVDLKPAMSLKTVVSFVKDLEKGRSVSYGQTFTAEKDMRVATVCIGYADGYPRSLSNKGYMLIHGKKAPIIGRVCMDQLMLDVTDIPDVKRGDTVTVFGTDGGECLPVDELADLCGTINYELVCLVGKRVPRVYLKNGKIVSVADYIL